MERDEAMRRALTLSERARFRAAPNPWVGCVLLRDGMVVGEGATEAPGGRHAEIVALDAAGPRAQGATAVVTLEPCAHQGRTGPCTSALIAAGVAEVVYAIGDPDPKVAGAGRRDLEAAGVAVTSGVAADEVARALRPYLHHRRTGRPWVVWKAAMSMDAHIAARDGSSRWITDEESRSAAHRLRAASQAILIGAGTARADDPALTVRDVGNFDGVAPLRVLLDAQGSTPARGPLFDPELGPTLVIAGAEADATPWRNAGADVVTVATDDRGVDPGAVLDELGRRGVLQLLVEGGARIAGSFLAADLVDEAVLFVAPLLLGSHGIPVADWDGPVTLGEAVRWNCAAVERCGPDVQLTYERRT